MHEREKKPPPPAFSVPRETNKGIDLCGFVFYERGLERYDLSSYSRFDPWTPFVLTRITISRYFTRPGIED